MKIISRPLSLCLSSAIILGSPGWASYTAAANLSGRIDVTVTGTQASQSKPVSISISRGADILLSPSLLSGNLYLQSALPLTVAPIVGAAKTALPAALALNGAKAAVAASVTPPAPGAQAAAAQKAAGLSAEVASTLRNFGEVSQAQPSSAHGLGHDIQSLLSGERFSSRSKGGFSVDARSFSSSEDGAFLAKPAGDSIRKSAESDSDGSSVPKASRKPRDSALTTGWVGAALKSALLGFTLTIKDVYHVLTSLRRDTVLRRRLLVLEGAQLILAAVAGTALGLSRVPLMLLWGASHGLSKNSKATKFLAYWARHQFLGSKSGLFNDLEKPLVGYANSKNKAVSLLAALGIRGAQLLWLAYNLLITPVAYVGGFVHAFSFVRQPYNPKLHDPEDLDLGKDELARPGDILK